MGSTHLEKLIDRAERGNGVDIRECVITNHDALRGPHRAASVHDARDVVVRGEGHRALSLRSSEVVPLLSLPISSRESTCMFSCPALIL